MIVVVGALAVLKPVGIDVGIFPAVVISRSISRIVISQNCSGCKIPDPFGNVSMHVIQAPRVGGFLSYLVRPGLCMSISAGSSVIRGVICI